jgi:Rrf2 family protein
MLISRETDYALRILRGLSDGYQHSVKSLCASQMVPVKFAYKIIGKLREAGLITTSSGAKGGCQMNRSPKHITLLDVIAAVEGDKPISKCTQNGFQCEWVENNCEACIVHKHLQELQTTIDKLLDKCTLEDLLNDEADFLKEE